ncbi:MAG: hypothetical protein LBV78_13485 [Kitasatospora sp.]|jgi:hypothetical protein|nr:hypothetical protein [Kitasatospora sp.]
MADYDLAVSLHQDALNPTLAALYDRPALKAALFRGTVPAQAGGPDRPGGPESRWAVLRAPVLSLDPPADDDWQHAIKRRPPAARPTADALVVGFPQLQVTYGDVSFDKAVRVVCTLAIHRHTLTVVPVAAIVDLTGATDWDRFLYTRMIGPRLLNLGATLIGGITLPHVKVAGAEFGEITLRVGGGRILGAARLAGEGSARLPPPQSLPDAPFYVLLSPRAVRRAAQNTLDAFSGQRHDTSGEAGFGIGTARYRAGIALRSAQVQVDPDPADIALNLRFTAYAAAEVDLFGGIEKELEQVGDSIAHFFSSY